MFSRCYLHQLLCSQYYILFVESQLSTSKNYNMVFHPLQCARYTILSTLHVLIRSILAVADKIGNIMRKLRGTGSLSVPQGHASGKQQSQGINQAFQLQGFGFGNRGVIILCSIFFAMSSGVCTFMYDELSRKWRTSSQTT